MIIKEPTLSYQCPSCGCYYFSSSVVSYSVFSVDLYSDGSWDPHGHAGLWLTHCPRCHAYFSLSHLVRLSSPPKPAAGECYGFVDYYRNGCESRYHVPFWHEAVAGGLFFPPSVDEDAREEEELDARLWLWHALNRHRDEHDEVFDESYYCATCRMLIDRIEATNDKHRLILAELYRNLGEFSASLDMLHSVEDPQKHEALLQAIRRAAEEGNDRTVKLPPR